MIQESNPNTEETKKKRGRKPKNTKEEYVVNREQTKFFVDLSKEKKTLNKVLDLLEEVNKKSYGKEITFKDISIYAIRKLSQKDFEKIQEGSLSEMEKVERALDEYNQKNNDSLSLGEFLVKQLKIS